MHHVLGMRADSAENAEPALNEERRLDQSAIDKMRKRIDMPDIVALDLEPRAVVGASREDPLDISERVLEDAVARSFQIRPLPVVFERLEPLQHGIEPE